VSVRTVRRTAAVHRCVQSHIGVMCCPLGMLLPACVGCAAGDIMQEYGSGDSAERNVCCSSEPHVLTVSRTVLCALRCHVLPHPVYCTAVLPCAAMSPVLRSLLCPLCCPVLLRCCAGVLPHALRCCAVSPVLLQVAGGLWAAAWVGQYLSMWSAVLLAYLAAFTVPVTYKALQPRLEASAKRFRAQTIVSRCLCLVGGGCSVAIGWLFAAALRPQQGAVWAVLGGFRGLPAALVAAPVPSSRPSTPRRGVYLKD
jgi:hypothetical protein